MGSHAQETAVAIAEVADHLVKAQTRAVEADAASPSPQTLCIFLIKQHIARPEDVLKDHSALVVKDVAVASTLIGRLYTRQQKIRPPQWFDFFAGTTELPRLVNAATAAVFLVEASGRLFAIAFGHGRHMLIPGAAEERFGILATLNTIDRNQLRSVDKQSLDPLRHTRTQSVLPGAMSSFGFDIEQDLLRAVIGRPLDASFGPRMSGMDSLHMSVSGGIAALTSRLATVLERYHALDYKDEFGWIDHIASVRDRAVLNRLNAKIVEHIRGNASSGDRVWLAAPHLIDWNAVGGFCYGSAKKAPRRVEKKFSDLYLADWLSGVRDKQKVSIGSLRQWNAFALGLDSDIEVHSWRVYDCVYAEIELDGRFYLLSSGTWFCVAKDFVDAVNESCAAMVTHLPNLPEYKHASEGAYNADVARGTSAMAMFDRDNIVHGGGPSRIEFCDLMSESGQMIHVKRYTGSAALSHLFSQGEVAAKTFLSDSEFRRKVRDKTPATHLELVPEETPRPSDYQVVFAVISESQAPIDKSLPFFSRVNLKNRAARLREMGLRVGLLKIQSSRAKTTAES